MIFTVKLDKKNNYFLDKTTGEIIEKYDSENKNLQLKLSSRIIDGSSIIQEYGGQIVVQESEDKYIIDDGYRNILIKAGYIVYRQYDIDRIEDFKLGNEIRSNLIDAVRASIMKVCNNCTIKSIGNETMIEISENGYAYIIRLDTISNIVNKNYKRKDNSLTYYPFEKSMDKYGTIYMSIFAQKLYNNDNDKYETANNIIRDLIKELGIEYHYTSVSIKGQVLYWPGL